MYQKPPETSGAIKITSVRRILVRAGTAWTRIITAARARSGGTKTTPTALVPSASPAASAPRQQAAVSPAPRDASRKK